MPPPVLIPGKYGVVLPFRYVEFFETPFEISPRTIRRAMVHYPLDMEESSFSCSDKGLERVYDFCKYSILATSYAGLYVDGDRERIPYEGDAYINQMGQYAISSDMALPRASHEYLIRHSTWPTEWKQHSIMMAWADWMWSGETTSVARCYEHLKTQKLLPDRIRADGLVMSPPQAITGPCSQIDLIDWPPRDRDGYVFCPASAVINAFHYRNLREMADLAKALFKDADAMEFACRAERLRERYNVLFWDDRAELYRDGEGADHHGLHANVVALAFGLTPDSRRGKVADYIVSRGMACSVYFSQYVLEALYVGGRPETALAIMTARGNRSWLGMLEQGATITMEAWNLNDKPNLDWNHAWGTPPLNVIARYVLGVTPLKPGFAKARIAPQPAGLTNVNGVVPTVKGGIAVSIVGSTLCVRTPVPAQVVWQGRTHDVGSGEHTF